MMALALLMTQAVPPRYLRLLRLPRRAMTRTTISLGAPAARGGAEEQEGHGRGYRLDWRAQEEEDQAREGPQPRRQGPSASAMGACASAATAHNGQE